MDESTMAESQDGFSQEVTQQIRNKIEAKDVKCLKINTKELGFIYKKAY